MKSMAGDLFRRFLAIFLSVSFVLPPSLVHAAAPVDGDADGDGQSAPMSGIKTESLTSLSGESTYTIRIAVPPGVHGMVPALALRYSSGSRDGRFGVGWGIDVGYPLFIERLGARHGATQHDHGDQFYFGGQRLLSADGEHFEARIKTFSQMTYSVAPLLSKPRPPDSWTVTLKNGTKLFYQGSEATVTGSYYLFHLRTITDIYGNQISFEYQVEGGGIIAEESLHLAAIHYTRTGVTDYQRSDVGNSGDNSIFFHLQPADRERPVISFGFGEAFVSSRLYERIDVQHQGGTVRAYQLTYRPSNATGRPLLVSVAEEGTGGLKSPPWTFSYEDKNSLLSELNRGSAEDVAGQFDFGEVGPNPWKGVESSHPNLIVYDQNCGPNLLRQEELSGAYYSGCSYKDRAYPLNNGTRIADLNGDGRLDVVEAINLDAKGETNPDGTDIGRVVVRINKGDGSFRVIPHSRTSSKPSDWNVPLYFVATVGYDSGQGVQLPGDVFYDTGAQLRDVNADNRADIIQSTRWFNEPYARTNVCINNGGGWDCCGTDPTTGERSCAGRDHGWNFPTTVDVNGATEDVYMVDVARERKEWNPQTTGEFMSFDMGYRFADLNADGLPDLVWSRGAFGPHRIDPALPLKRPAIEKSAVWLNTGNGWSQVSDGRWAPPYPFILPNVHTGWYGVKIGKSLQERYSHIPLGVEMIDLNDDGLSDMVRAFHDASLDYFDNNTRTADDLYYNNICINTGSAFSCVEAEEPLCAKIWLDQHRCKPHSLLPFAGVVEREQDIGNGREPKWYYSSLGEYQSQFVDLNQDGLPDEFVSYYDANSKSYQSYYSLNLGSFSWAKRVSFSQALPAFSYHKQVWTDKNSVVPFDSLGLGVQFLDVDSDGGDDILIGRFTNKLLFEPGAPPEPMTMHKILRIPTAPADALRSVTVPSGGQLSFNYDPVTKVDKHLGRCVGKIPQEARQLDDRLVESSAQRYVVTETRLLDPLTMNVDDPTTEDIDESEPVVTRYDYDGEVQNFIDRENRGFAYVKSYQLKFDEEGNEVGEGPFSETCYGQTDAYQGLALWGQSGEGTFVTETKSEYAPVESPADSGVIWQKFVRSATTVYGEDGDPADAKLYGSEVVSYDGYGNVTASWNRGEVGSNWFADETDVGPLGDDLLSESTYRYRNNGTDYVVDRVWISQTKDPTGRLLGLSQNDYSDNAEGPIGSGGLKYLRRVGVGRNYPLSLGDLIFTQMTQYSWGDLKSTISPPVEVWEDLGSYEDGFSSGSLVTEYIYRNNGMVAPSQVIVGRGTSFARMSQSYLDLGLGVVLRTVAEDGQVVVSSYDGLGRLETVSKPLVRATPLVVNQYELVGYDAMSGKHRLSPTTPNKLTVTTYRDGDHTEIAESYIGGFGNGVQSRQDDGGGLGLYSGLVVQDRMGQVWKAYRGFQSRSTGFMDEEAIRDELKLGETQGYTETFFLSGKVKKVVAPEVDGVRVESSMRYGSWWSEVTDGNGVVTRSENEVDGDGRESRTIQAYGTNDEVTRVQRSDRLGRLLAVYDQRDGVTPSTEFGYDAHGRGVGKNAQDYQLGAVTVSTAANASKPYQVRYEYNDLGKLVKEVWGTAAGNPTADQRVVVVKYLYDLLGRNVATCVRMDGVDPYCDPYLSGNDLVGLRYYDRDSQGLTTAMSMGKLVTAIGYGVLGYSNLGKPIRGETGRVDYVYENPHGTMSRLVQKVTKDTKRSDQEIVTSEFGYDWSARLVNTTVLPPDDETWVIRYNYDNLGRMSWYRGVSPITVNGEAVLFDVEYDGYGRTERTTLGNGMETTYGYDDRDFLTSLDHGADKNGKSIYGVTYLRDAAGNIETIDGQRMGLGSADFIYDKRYQLTEVRDHRYYGAYPALEDPAQSGFYYFYDNAGNILWRQEKQLVEMHYAPGKNQISEIYQDGIAQPAPTYDARGNVTNDGITSYRHSYDQSNRIFQSVDGNDRVLINFDGFGRKVRRIHRKSNGTEESKTYFYSGDSLAYEQKGGESTLYVYGLGRQLAQVKHDGTIEYFHHDHLGSVAAVTDSAVKIPTADQGVDRPDPLSVMALVDGQLQVNLPKAYPRSRYRATLKVVGGVSPYRWVSLVGLPAGLSHQAAGDELAISGNAPACQVVTTKPSQEYHYFTVNIEDAQRPAGKATVQFLIPVNCGPVEREP